MLLLRVKEINLHGRQVKLFSLDGTLGASRPSDIEKFQRRVEREKNGCRRQLQYVRRGDTPVVPVDLDFWP